MDRMQFIQADHKARQAQKNIAAVTETIAQLRTRQAEAERLGMSDITNFSDYIANAEIRLAKYQATLDESNAIVAAYKAQKAASR